jgi:hypothetical protein
MTEKQNDNKAMPEDKDKSKPSKEEREKVIRQVFYDTDTGYQSVHRTYEESKKIMKSITLKDVKEFLNKQSILQTKKYKTYNSYVADAPLHEFQIDLAVYEKSAKYNDGYKFAFCCIDIYTKYAFCVALKSKQKQEVANAFKEILNHMGICRQVMCDFEGSFVSNEFKSILDQYGIKLLISSNPAPFIERFLQTFKHMINIRLKAKGAIEKGGYEKGWVQLIPVVLKQYNSTPHSTIEMSPIMARQKENELLVKFNIQNKAKYARKYPKIEINNKVRKYKKPDNFSGKKATVSKWSENVHKVINIKDGLYYLDDGQTRGYMRHDLLRVEGSESLQD